MWLLAHVGSTMGLAALVDGACRVRRQLGSQGAVSGVVKPEGRGAQPARAVSGWNRSPGATHGPDYRLLAIGAVLPDLDKLIGLASGHAFERNYFHTALCVLILSGAVVYWWRRTGGTRPLQVAGCWLLHLALDGMWAMPGVLLWTALGGRMPGGDMGWADFLAYTVRSLSGDPKQYVPEIVGIGIVFGLYWAMQRGRAARMRWSD